MAIKERIGKVFGLVPAEDEDSKTNALTEEYIPFDQFDKEARIKEVKDTKGNLAKRFHGLVDENPLAEALADKAKSLIMGEGWSIFSASKNERADKILKDFWTYFGELWDDFVSEAIITGSLSFEPEVNDIDQSVRINFIPTQNVKDVELKNYKPYEVEIEEKEDSQPVKRSVIQKGPHLNEDENGDKQLSTDYEGEVFFFRFNNKLTKKFGKSRFQTSEVFIRGFAEMGGNLIGRTRIMQMLSFAVKGFQLEGNKDKDEARKTSFRNLAKGKNQIIFLKDGESVESQTPNMRHLDMPSSITKMLEMALLRWEFPPILFSQPGGTNLASAKEAVKGFVSTYTELQTKFMKCARMIAHYVVTRQIPEYDIEDISFNLPDVFRKSIDEKLTDQTSQHAYLRELRDDRVITEQVFKEQALIVARGGTINIQAD